MIVRELTGGVYFGQPRFIEDLPGGGRRGVDTQVYTTMEIERIARVAFELARGRRNKVHSAEKSNVMETGLLWRQVVTDLHAREYADVELEHILADNMAMQIVKAPKQFDVLVTDNLFGDILSDAAAQLTGSLGMLPSAAFGLNPGRLASMSRSTWSSAGHRRPGGRQSAGGDPVVRDGAALVARPRRAGRQAVRRGRRGARRRCADARSRRRSMTTVQMADAVLAEL